jgi:hypothetical protein
MASGDTLVVFGPLNNEPTATAYATIDLINLRPVLDFDTAADESAVFTGVLPRNYAGGGVTVYIHWAGDTDHDTSKYVNWEVAFEQVAAGENTGADDFAAVNFAKAHPDDTVRYLVITTVAFTDGADMGSVVAGNMFRMKISRDANGSSDTDDMPGDASLFAVEIKET